MSAPSSHPPPGTVIVFVHGAIVNGHEMLPLRRRLRKLGYVTRQFHWKSITGSLDENLDRLAKFVASTEADTLHVVGHSMGGVLTRLLFERAPDPRPGRLVAIGSPLTDCWTGRKFIALHPRLTWLAGIAVRDYLAKEIDPIWRGSRDFGVLAGTYPFGIGALFPDLPAPSDGVVLVERNQPGGHSRPSHDPAQSFRHALLQEMRGRHCLVSRDRIIRKSGLTVAVDLRARESIKESAGTNAND